MFDEGIIVRVMLKPQVGFREGDWDVRPGGAEMFAFADMQDCAKVFFSLMLCLVNWLIRFTGDGIDDIYHSSDGIISSLRDRTRF